MKYLKQSFGYYKVQIKLVFYFQEQMYQMSKKNHYIKGYKLESGFFIRGANSKIEFNEDLVLSRILFRFSKKRRRKNT